MTREGEPGLSSRRFFVAVSMASLQRLLLFAIILGLSYGSSEEESSEEQWKTRYAPLECEKPPSILILRPGKFQRWFYNATSSKCQLFRSKLNISTRNNFPSKDACNRKCRDKHYGMCADPKNSSVCDGTNQVRFWFNPENKTCERYSYHGCDGNTNSFRSRFECVDHCGEFIDDICSLPIHTGDCSWPEIRFGYNPNFKACESFNYTGCGGNRNNFRTAHACWTTCAKDSRCLKHTQENSQWYRWRKSYYYNSVMNECRLTKTIFGKSMGPKYNRFPNITECQRVCKRKHVPTRIYPFK